MLHRFEIGPLVTTERVAWAILTKVLSYSKHIAHSGQCHQKGVREHISCKAFRNRASRAVVTQGN